VGSNLLNLSSADGGSVLLRGSSALRDIGTRLVHAAETSGTVGVSGALVVGVVLLHVHGNLSLAHDGVGDLLGNSPVHGDGLVTVLSEWLLHGDGVGDLDGAGNLDLTLVVDDLGHGDLNLLDLVSADGHANGVGNHDGLGDHDDLVDVTDGRHLHLLGDSLENRAVGGDLAGNPDGLDVIHGVVNLLGCLAGNLDGLGVVNNLGLEGLDLLGAEGSVSLLHGVLLRLVSVHGRDNLLGDGNAAGVNPAVGVATVVVVVSNDGAVAAGVVNRTVRSH